jgi:hypothetical protein
MTAAYSPGWRARVELGAGQERVRQALLASVRHPSRTWHDAPRMRELNRWSSVAHRELHRLAALGVVALQTTRGARGGTRFTFGVRHWHRAPRRIGQLARMFGRAREAPAPGQLTLGLAEGERRARGPARTSWTPPSAGELLERYGFRPWWRR